MMHYRTVGKTGIRLSVIGFGTAQLRMVPERQAIAALRLGFELGVNWVHTASDYEGAEIIVARAIAESGLRDIAVLSNAAGSIEHFGWAFENTRRILGRKRLQLFGISGIDYCEQLGQNIWERGGLLDFLQQKKREGRLEGIFCTTHGSPEYVTRLITCGCFDAVMLSYNPLGFHVLSYYGQAEGKDYEDLERNRMEIFPLAQKHQVSLLVMKPLAGGLLCRSKAFPPRGCFGEEVMSLKAGDVLKTILQYPGVCAVVPGTASVEEAEENACAGHAPFALTQQSRESLAYAVRQMQGRLCSRCGACESTCCKALPISWLFRESYIWHYPSDTFEALGRCHYFKLHPNEEPICSNCTQRTCACPAGLDIPAALSRVHYGMMDLHKKGLIHTTPDELEANTIHGQVAVRIVSREIPLRLRIRELGICRLWIENAGRDSWLSFLTQPQATGSLALVVFRNGSRIYKIPLKHDVGPGQRTHFTFELQAPRRPGRYTLQLSLMTISRWKRLTNSTPLLKETLEVEEDHT